MPDPAAGEEMPRMTWDVPRIQKGATIPPTDSLPRMTEEHVEQLFWVRIPMHHEADEQRTQEIQQVIRELASPDGRYVLVPREDHAAMVAVGRIAFAMAEWSHSPGGVANQLLEEVGKVSGVIGNDLILLGKAFGMKAGEWTDDPRWLASTPSTTEDDHA